MARLAKRSRKPRDLNAMAASIVGDATNEAPAQHQAEKDPAAVALGRRGGLKGGRPRAAKMTPAERSEAARRAAAARWKKN
jgi:hypothetical protein